MIQHLVQDRVDLVKLNTLNSLHPSRHLLLLLGPTVGSQTEVALVAPLGVVAFRDIPQHPSAQVLHQQAFSAQPLCDPPSGADPHQPTSGRE